MKSESTRKESKIEQLQKDLEKAQGDSKAVSDKHKKEVNAAKKQQAKFDELNKQVEA